LAAEILKKYEHDIESLTLIPSQGGVYEIVVDGELIYSKETNGRHAEPGEVARLLDQYLKEGNR
jgi:selenoprotein W-related protein